MLDFLSFLAGLLPFFASAQAAPTTETIAVKTAIVDTIPAARTLASYSDRNAYFEPVFDSLLQRGADPSFVEELMRDENLTFYPSALNLTVFNIIPRTVKVTMAPKPARSAGQSSYSHNYNVNSITSTKNFINTYKTQLDAAEREFGVPGEVVASLMWVETKHGRVTGTYHVPSAFMSIAMADQPETIKAGLVRRNYKVGTKEYENAAARMEPRARKKSDWALDELMAIAKMREAGHTYANLAPKGSFAGAFGLCQFLPSSYLTWGVDGNKDGVIDLFSAEDAIYSVANYLKSNGWSTSASSKTAAVFHYNNSSDYVNAVLTLSEKV